MRWRGGSELGMHRMNQRALFLQQYSSLVETSPQGKKSAIWKAVTAMSKYIHPQKGWGFNLICWLAPFKPSNPVQREACSLLPTKASQSVTAEWTSCTAFMTSNLAYFTWRFWRPRRCALWLASVTASRNASLASVQEQQRSVSGDGDRRQQGDSEDARVLPLQSDRRAGLHHVKGLKHAQAHTSVFFVFCSSFCVY